MQWGRTVNAIEFVKKFGFIEAKNTLDDCIFLEATFFNCLGFDICVSDLKQIVDAWELVERFGGLEESKKLHYDEFRSDTSYNKLQKAINLVEQCQ